MSLHKTRLKILEKIAQTQTKSVAGSPPKFVASDIYPSIMTAFQSKNVPLINALADLLNTVMYYTSNGQVNMMQLRNNNFNLGTDQVISADLKNLMEFSKILYNQVFTNLGVDFKSPLSSQQISDKITVLKNSSYLNNLSNANLTGQVATKVSGNPKELIKNYLLQIK